MSYRCSTAKRQEKTDFARKLRSHQTDAEKRLWTYLRKKRMCGARFGRQRLVLGYIADFFCPRLRIVVECDGEIHESLKEKDLIRNEAMRNAGFAVLRFKNSEIFNDIIAVLTTIKTEVLSRSNLPT